MLLFILYVATKPWGIVLEYEKTKYIIETNKVKVEMV